jgi:hypothetical protein
VEKPKVKRQLERLRLREEDNIKMYFQSIRWELGLNCCDSGEGKVGSCEYNKKLQAWIGELH